MRYPKPPVPQKKLLVDVTLRLGDGILVEIKALVDTGAETSLLKIGLLPSKYARVSKTPKRFVAVNQAALEGGKVEFDCGVILRGTNTHTGLVADVECPTTFFDGNIGVDAILSYGWLAKNFVDVQCGRHGLMVNLTTPFLDNISLEDVNHFGGAPLWAAGVVF